MIEDKEPKPEQQPTKAENDSKVEENLMNQETNEASEQVNKETMEKNEGLEDDKTSNQESEEGAAGEEIKEQTVSEELNKKAEEDTEENVAAESTEAIIENKEEETPAPIAGKNPAKDQDQNVVSEEKPGDVTEEKEEEIEEDEEDELDQLVEEDFSQYSMQEFVQLSKNLLKEEDLRKADQIFKKARVEVEQLQDTEVAEARAKYKEANNGEEEGFEFKGDPLAKEFFDNHKALLQKKKSYYANLNKERENNLKAKQDLITELKTLVEATDQAGSMAKIKNIQKTWKEIGSVPQIEAENLYKTYSALLDMFYDQKSIEYDLKELDRKKNLETKIELCEKAEALSEVENINSAIQQLNQLHDEYKHTGPVPKEKQEEVWERFKAASDKLYDKKREFAEEYKKVLQENMKLKQELCLKLEPFLAFDSDRIKEWNEKTKELLAIQEEWEAIGPLPREVAKDINKQFWGNFKAFFANKNKFFEKLEETRKENLKIKEGLCEQAEALKDSTDWNNAADKLKKLQQDWRKVGPIPEAHRDSIYARFKAACDHFFERKRNKRSEQEKEFVENFEKKLAICKQIEELANQNSEDFDKLNSLKEAYMAIGYVPRKEINNILESFISAIDLFYQSLPGLDDDKKEEMKLKAHVDIYKESPNLLAKLRKQEQGIRKKISHLENDIALWENNLQFFANSKTADKLKKEFSEKIDVANKKLIDLKAQLKLIRKIN